MCQVQLWYSCLDIFLKRSLFVPVNIGHHKSAALEEKSWHKWITICRKRQTHLSLKRRRAKVGDVHKILAKHKLPKLVKVDLNVTSILDETKSEIKGEGGEDGDEEEGEEEKGDWEGRRLVCHWKCSYYFSWNKYIWKWTCGEYWKWSNNLSSEEYFPTSEIKTKKIYVLHTSLFLFGKGKTWM